MSTTAILWALNPAKTGRLPAEARLVLVALADHSDAKGRGAYPAQSTIATACDLSERAVRRHLSTLRGRGLIYPGDQSKAVVNIPRADRRPVVYDLAMSGERPDTAVLSWLASEPANERTEPSAREWSAMAVTGGHSWSLRGDTCGRHGGTVGPPNQEQNQLLNPCG